MSQRPISTLVTPEWLVENKGSVKILDASWVLGKKDNKDVYQREHIPNALFFDIDHFADLSTSLPHMLPSSEQFGRQVGEELGFSNEDHIVVYDMSGFYVASARVWWTFRVFGHDSVSVLEGGLPNWKSKGFPLTSTTEKITPKNFVANYRSNLVVDMKQVRENISSKKFQLIDARAEGRFSGTTPDPRPGVAAGHIPGSFNLPFTSILTAISPTPEQKETPPLTFLPPAPIQTILEQQKISLASDIATSCGSGVTASVLALGLYLSGKTDVPVYDGSWTEWGSDPETTKAISKLT